MVNIPCKLLCSYKYYIDNTFNYSINIRYKLEYHKNMFTKCVVGKLPWQLAIARSYALRMRRMWTPMFHRQEVWLTFSTVKFHHVALRQIVRESLFPPPKVGQQQVGARKQCVAVKYTHTQPTFPVFSQMTYCPFNGGRGLLGWSCNLVWAEHRSVHSGPIHKQDITVRIESSHNRLYFVLSSSSGPDVRGEPEPDMFTSSGHCGPPREQLWLPMADPAVDGFDFMYAARSASEPSSAPEECFGRFQTLILAFALREWID